MPKNVVILCDGTGKSALRTVASGDEPETNVLKLYWMCQRDDDQRVFYQTGIGTTTDAIATPAAQGLGEGIERDIGRCYQFLIDEYRLADRIFLFGFSRGAYVARAVAALVHAFGIPGYTQRDLIGALVASFSTLRSLSDQGKRADELDRLRGKFRLPGDSTRVHFLGVWDTVVSVPRGRTIPFIRRNPSIDTARHAVALDERRAFFEPTLLYKTKNDSGIEKPDDLLQVWFPGDHSDVGGGYPPDQSRLSTLTLGWILHHAKASGLHVDATAEWRHAPPADMTQLSKSLIHESLTWKWYLGEYVPRWVHDYENGKTTLEVHRGRRRVPPPASFIHESAYMLGATYQKLLPTDGVRYKHP